MVLVLMGTALLLLPFASTRPLHLNEALFTAVSALTVTGLSIITPATDLTLAGQFILLILIQTGGVGFMVLAAVIFALLGRKITLIDRLAITDSMGLVRPGAVLRLTRNVIIGVHVIEVIGATLLWLNWRAELGDARALWYGLFHAVSAFCNAGFDLFTNAPYASGRAFGGIPNDGSTLFILGTLIVLGGLGIPVLSDLLEQSLSRFKSGPSRKAKARALSLHTRLTLVTALVLVLIGTVGLFVAEGQPTHTLANETFARRLQLSAFQSVAARTAGFVAVPAYSFEALAPASQLLMSVLMFIGCAPASMGGGITTGTLAVLVLALWSYVRRYPQPRIGNRSLATGTVRRAAAVLTVSAFVVLAAAWLILVSHPGATLDQALFEVISAFATCGLTLAFTTNLNLFGQAVIMAVMFWGRLGALTIVTAIAQQQQSTSARIAYPEEQVLIG